MEHFSIHGIYRVFHILFFVGKINTASKAESKDFCVRDEGVLGCPYNHIIVISTALYGRMRTQSKCITTNYASQGCSSDVTSYLEEKCSGKSNCTFSVKDLIDLVTPCPIDLTSYLQVDHLCEPALRLPPQKCGEELILSGPGYMMVTRDYHAFPCPVYLRVQPMQTVRVNHLLFGAPKSQQIPGPAQACAIRLEVSEERHDKPTVIDLCDAKVGQFYSSKKNIVRVTVLGSQLQDKGSSRDIAGLLQYTVLGCPDIKAPIGGFVDRKGDQAMVQCNATKETWYLTCQGNMWLGGFENCTVAGHYGDKSVAERTLPQQGLLIAVCIGILIGVLLGLILLGLVYVCLKRSRNSPYEDPTLALGHMTPAQHKDAYASMLRPEMRSEPQIVEYCRPEPVDVLVWTQGRETSVVPVSHPVTGRTVSTFKSTQCPAGCSYLEDPVNELCSIHQK